MSNKMSSSTSNSQKKPFSFSDAVFDDNALAPNQKLQEVSATSSDIAALLSMQNDQAKQRDEKIENMTRMHHMLIQESFVDFQKRI